MNIRPDPSGAQAKLVVLVKVPLERKVVSEKLTVSIGVARNGAAKVKRIEAAPRNRKCTREW
jgi:hypothetical protein